MGKHSHPSRFLTKNAAFTITIHDRTHQIRVHLAHSGHPVVGDKIYGPSEECYLDFMETGWSSTLEKQLWHPRHALHSSILGVNFLGTSYRWECMLPPDLQNLLTGQLGKL